MGFQVRIEAVERISEYRGITKDGTGEYCVGTWKVKNVADNTMMLVSCFGKDDEALKEFPNLALDATLTIVCRDWSKDGRSGSMNNVNLSNIITPERIDAGVQEVAQQNAIVNQSSIFNPNVHSDLPF